MAPAVLPIPLREMSWQAGTAVQRPAQCLWRYGFLATVSLLALASVAEARSARCATSDEGKFACDFQATDRDGSFRISAPGKPTYFLNIVEPGIAYGFVNLGERNVALPGRFVRSRSDPGCWLNDETRTRICAW